MSIAYANEKVRFQRGYRQNYTERYAVIKPLRHTCNSNLIATGDNETRKLYGWVSVVDWNRNLIQHGAFHWENQQYVPRACITSPSLQIAYLQYQTDSVFTNILRLPRQVTI